MRTEQALELMQAVAAKNGTPLVIDDDNRKAMTLCAAWLARERSEGIDVNKGLMIVGHVGSGKTTLMRVLREAMREAYGAQFGIRSCSDMVRGFTDNGSEAIEAWITAPHVCFDDLGTEPLESVNYGNRKNVMKDVLEARYERMGRGEKAWTHLTTNLSPANIATNYGERCASRLRQIVNVIDLGASAESRDRRRTAPAPMPNKAVDADNIYSVIHPNIAAKMGEMIAPIVAKLKADRPVEMKVAHSAERDREGFAMRCAEMSTEQLNAYRESYLKQYPMNTQGHTEAMLYVAIIDAEVKRIREAEELPSPLDTPTDQPTAATNAA